MSWWLGLAGVAHGKTALDIVVGKKSDTAASDAYSGFVQNVLRFSRLTAKPLTFCKALLNNHEDPIVEILLSEQIR